ncbi:Cupin 2 conserved barrel [Penicillium capsulatum]|uniref:Cupin 2 conserved barrel n=1 Tax=Penicillium capsulatum TaxID=69766 RepID=A0A9W9LR88_9EURO|nr:Cupin 2 conserved barrel [Penicillium capsulatum]KAJ6136167.1 Cupin 2 conserved barrel [Penicillium capsulatum]
MANSTSKLVILPPSYTTTTTPESFPTPANGNLSWHTLFSQPQTPTSDLSAGVAVCPPKTGHLCAHRHRQAEIYYILEGEGEVTIDGVTSRVSKDSTVFIPSDAEHGIVNVGPGNLRWFYVFPTSAFSDVVYRFKNEGKAKL